MWSLQVVTTNTDVTIQPTGWVKAKVILNTLNYNWKVSFISGGPGLQEVGQEVTLTDGKHIS
jgi:hypothetical protein